MAVALVVAGFVAFVVGSVEAAGLATGRVTVDVTDLPTGLTKAEHIALLEDLAIEHDVTFALLVPDRSGTPARLDAYVFNGEPARPAFWGTIAEHPASSIGDAVMAWSYAVDGATPDVERFVRALQQSGFELTMSTTQTLPLVLEVLSQPGVAMIAVASSVGVLVSLVAESYRRAPRQRLRRIAGWTLIQIARRELLEIVVLVTAGFVIAIGALAAFLLVRGAGAEVWRLCATTIILLVPLVGFGVVLGHVGLGMVSGRQLGGADLSRWRPTVVGAAGALLVVVLASGAVTMNTQSQTVDRLLRSLAEEASAGDDVVLGVGFPDDRQELTLGRIGAAAIARGAAQMAMTTMLRDGLVVAGEGLRGVPSAASELDGVTVLVPAVMSQDADRIESETRAALAEGWEVDVADAPRTPIVRSWVVPSTASLTQGADRWIDRSSTGGAPAAEVPVVVLSDLRDLAPNRIGTATRNGEVRFSDRDALTRALRSEGVMGVVTQINRVGAVIDRQVAAARMERLVLVGAMVVASLAALFAAAALVTDHRTRICSASRLRFLFGRHPVVDHRRFVLVGAGVSAAAVLLGLSASSTVDTATGAVIALASAVSVAAVLALLLGVAHLTERKPR